LNLAQINFFDNSMKPATTTLDPIKIIETVDLLRLRIAERFPQSGLLRVCTNCLGIAQQARERSEYIDRPIYWLRATIWLIVLALVFGIISVTVFLPRHLLDITENWETIEAITSETLLLAAGLFFLVSLETRFKRKRALSAIHELRALAHVIDMHQLTKDPERLLRNWVSSEHSPKMTMNAFELGRYLDYCGEMLSLIGKIAAVYVQRFDDEVALEAVNEVEMLTASLNGRIWQKTMLLSSLAAETTEGRHKSIPLIANPPAPSRPPESAT
jgi:hypothetical protein